LGFHNLRSQKLKTTPDVGIAGIAHMHATDADERGMATSIAGLAERLRSARRVTVLTGAGVSAASGVPTFRGSGGLWRQYRAEDLATPEAFARDPRLVWEWYDWRRQIVARCAPNAAHRVLADWSRRLPGFTLLTQNVDGLHEEAGAEHVVRLHGSLWRVRCQHRQCATGVAREDRRVPLPDLPPHCDCGALLRPDIVWFGEMLDRHDATRAQQATACDVFLTIGTSAIVYPAAGLVHTAKAHGAYTVEVNPEATDASDAVDLSLRGPAEVVLAEVDAALSRC
jgi:NAD-dependent deacetylase